MIVGERKQIAIGSPRTSYASDTWTVSVGSAHTNFPKEKVQQDLLDDCWLAWGQAPSQTWIELKSSNEGPAFTVDTLSLLGLSRDTSLIYSMTGVTGNQWRLRIDSFPLKDRIRPGIASIAPTNLTGTAADISGPVEPPITPSPGYIPTRLVAINQAVNTQVIVTFDDHTAERALSSTGTQTFRVYVGDSDDPEIWPTVAVTLRRNGADVGSPMTANNAEKLDEGFVLNFLVAAGSMPAFTGAFGLNIVGTSTGTSVPELIKVEWVAEIDETAVTFDSENEADQLPFDMTAFGKGLYWILDSPLVVPAAGSGLFVYIHLEFTRLSRQEFITVSGATVPVREWTEVVPEFKAGRATVSSSLVNDLLSPSGLNWRRTSDVPFTRTRAGSTRSNRVALQWKEADLLLPFIPNEDMLEQWEIFFDSIGMKTPFLFVPDPSRPECYWVICTSWNSDHVGYFTGDGDSDERYDLAFSIAEHQAMMSPRG